MSLPDFPGVWVHLRCSNQILWFYLFIFPSISSWCWPLVNTIRENTVEQEKVRSCAKPVTAELPLSCFTLSTAWVPSLNCALGYIYVLIFLLPAHPQPQHPGVCIPDSPGGWHRILPAPPALHPVSLSAGVAVLHRLDTRDGPSHRFVLKVFGSWARLNPPQVTSPSTRPSLFQHSREFFSPWLARSQFRTDCPAFFSMALFFKILFSL